MNILILGSQGFIGSHIVARCMSEGHIITGCDLVENGTIDYNYHKVSILSPDFETVFSSVSFDVCINASGSGNVSYSLSHPLSDFEANTMAVVKVLDTIRKYQPKCKYIHLSSAAVYGNPKQLPIKESDLIAPLSPYGFHKWMSEIICQEYSMLFNIPVAILRPFSVYGPGLRKQLIWDVYQKYLNGSGNLELAGTGNESRDFIYVEDLAGCVLLINEKAEMKGEIYNVASGKESTVRDVINILFSHVDPSALISFNNSVRQGDPLNWKADISKISKLGFKPAYSLETGLEKVADWLNAQQ